MSEPVATAEEARPNVDLELEQRVKGSCGRISENAHIFANEPSLACYRLQEHVRRSLGAAVERRLQLTEARHELRGKCYDLDYSIGALKGFQQSKQHLDNIQELLKNAVFVKQQLAHGEARQLARRPSRLQRLSGSFDLAAAQQGPGFAGGLSSSPSLGSDMRACHPAATLRSASASPRRPRAASVSSDAPST
uniref:BLOC-1-related complex subunit 8 n=1 Tax=Ixodes ricinus TaxID=34613 RepID=A0A131Y1Q6_IXORI